MNKMFFGILRLFFIVSLILGLVFVPGAFAITGQALVSEVQKRYESTTDLEADFNQEYIGKIMKKSQHGEGKVFFKKKGMMLWDYTVPKQKFVADGHTLWYYQPEEKQVFVSGVDKFLKEKTPLAFLAGEGDLSRDFNLINFSEAAGKDETYVLELSPSEPQPGLSKLILTVHKKTYYVIQVDVVDELENVTRTRFHNIKTNKTLPRSMFQFTIPPGTEIIKVQDQPASPTR